MVMFNSDTTDATSYEKLEDTKGVSRSRKSKIPKGLAEAVNRRRTDNTMAKTKKQKWRNNDP